MAGTFKHYDIKEVAIRTVHKEDLGNSETIKIGDIIAMREPHHCIGAEEGTRFLWLRLEGLEDAGWPKLSQVIQDPDYDEAKLQLRQLSLGVITELSWTVYDKRRCCIPFHRLKEVCPWLDLNRVLDPEDYYQPFVVPDSDSGFYVAPRNLVLRVEGLVFDKVKGRYL